MARKRSSQSTHGPFVNTETPVPPLTLNTWQANHDEPFNFFSSPSPSPSSPAFKTRKTATGRVPTHLPDYSSMSVYDPADYVRHAQPALSPSSPINIRSRRNSNQNLTPCSNLSQSPSTCTSDGLTNPTTLSSVSMSRSDSLGGTSLYGPLAMLKVDSQKSDCMKFDSHMDESSYTLESTPHPTKVSISATDASMSLSHTGAMLENNTLTSAGLVPEHLKLPLVVEEEFAMSRTASLESVDSSKSRISRRSQEQAALSARPIAPKDNTELMSRQVSSSSSYSGSEMAPQRSEDGSKVAIQKAKYQRPTHEKIKCQLCTLKPDGYRGPHELRRHMDNKHGQTRKVWVCKDISPDQMFLSKCKQCREKKMYGAYYNAACHLRRIHFNPRGKGKKADKSAPRRGGNGGGDYPSMDHLKLWMEEISVQKDTSITEDDQDDDQEDDDSSAKGAADASQSDLEYPAYDSQNLQSEVLCPDNVNIDPGDSEYHESPSQNNTGESTQAEIAVGNTFSNPYPTLNDLSPRSDAIYGRVSSTSLTPPCDPYYDDITMPKSFSMASNVALNNLEAAELSLTSSMNNPFDQFNSFSLDSEVPCFN